MSQSQSTMMKSWVSSVFDTTASTSDSSNKNTVDAKGIKLRPTKKRAFEKQEKSSTTHHDTKNNNKLTFAEKYRPTQRSELMVNKSKVEQLSQALDGMFALNNASGASRILMIEGPPGSGKTATLKVLCDETNIKLIRWDNFSGVKLTNFEIEDSNNNENQHNYNESQLKSFGQFLFKSSRYNTNQLFSSIENESSSNDGFQNNQKKRCLFIKEIPNAAFRDSFAFQSLLRNFVKYSKCPLIFCVTNTTYASESNPARLFGSDIRKELKFVEVTFNGFAASYMLKAIEAVVRLEEADFDKNLLNEICASSDGDLRQALNQVEINLTQNKKDTNLLFNKGLQSSKTAKKKRTQVLGESTEKSLSFKKESPHQQLLHNCKDTHLSMFRGLGKILHRKTLDPSEPLYNQRLAIENDLPAHLVKQGKKRLPMTCEPEEILSKIPLSSDSINLYLNQNYLEIFAEKSSSQKIDHIFDSLIGISDNFIHTDFLNARANTVEVLSNGNNSALLKEISNLVTMRSVLFYSYFENNVNTVKKEGNSGGGSLWKPLFKPYNYKMNETKNERKRKVEYIIQESEESSILSKYIHHGMNNELFTHYIPLMFNSNAFKKLPANKKSIFLSLKSNFSKFRGNGATLSCFRPSSDDNCLSEANSARQIENEIEEVTETAQLVQAQSENSNNQSLNKYNYKYETTALNIDEFNF